MRALDPQLVCYSWITGIPQVAQIVFVRKRSVEVHYLRTTITDEQRREFGQLAEDTIGRIESAHFLPHSGVRFPQNPCSSCPYVGFASTKIRLLNLISCDAQEQKILVGLTNLHIRNSPVLPKLNQRRALFVLTKVDEILSWEKKHEAERDARFVELGRYLCEVRAGQYWRVVQLASFDDFLAWRFPESRRKAYYLMSIHEHLPPQARRDLNKSDGQEG